MARYNKGGTRSPKIQSEEGMQEPESLMEPLLPEIIEEDLPGFSDLNVLGDLIPKYWYRLYINGVLFSEATGRGNQSVEIPTPYPLPLTEIKFNGKDYTEWVVEVDESPEYYRLERLEI